MFELIEEIFAEFSRKKTNPKSFGRKKSFRSFDPEVENEETELSFQGGDQKLRKLVEISGKEEEEEKKRGRERKRETEGKKRERVERKRQGWRKLKQLY